MNLFSGLFHSRDKPQNRTGGSAFSFFMGNSTSGKRVNERTAMQMTAVYSCVRILSEAVASLPLHFYEYQKDGSKIKAVDHPIYSLLHDEPNPEMTSFAIFLAVPYLKAQSAASFSKAGKKSAKYLSKTAEKVKEEV